MTNISPYRQLEHTSDIKVEIYGRDLPELFRHAAFCLFDLMLDMTKVEPKQHYEVRLDNTDLSELFLDWLRELLFLFSAHGFAVCHTEVRILPADLSNQHSVSGNLTSAVHLSATLHGEPYDSTRHGFKVEVKTPTYHEYRLEQTPSGYRVTLVLDV